MRSLRRQALTGVRWSAIQNWGSKLAAFVVFLVLARLLAPEDFGVVAVAAGLVAIVETIVDAGFGEAIVQRQVLEDAHLSTAFWVVMAAAVAVTLALVGTAPAVARLLGNPALAPVLQAIALCVPLNASCVVQHALLRREFRYRLLAARTGAAIVLGGVVGIVLAARGFGVWSLVAQLLVQSVVSMAVLWWAGSWRPRRAFSGAAARALASFGVHVLLNRWLHVLNARLYDVLIGASAGPAAAGYYSVGARLPQSAQQLLGAPVADVGLSLFARLAANREAQRRAYLELVRGVVAVCLPVFAGLAVLAPHLVPILFGDRWLAAVEVLRAIAVFGALLLVEYVNSPVILGSGQPQLGWRINLARCLSALALFALTSPHGLAAIAWGYASTALLTAPMSCAYALRLLALPVRALAREVLPSVCAVALLAVAMLGVEAALGARVSPAVLVALELAAGAVTYVAAYFLFWPVRARGIRVALLAGWGGRA